MTKNKLTTRDLISDIIELESQIEVCADIAEREELQGQLVKVKKDIERKMKNLDVFDFELTRKNNLLQSEIDTLLDEAKRLKQKQHKKQLLQQHHQKSQSSTILEIK